MSSRFTAPVSKLTRCISTSSSVSAPSHLLVNGSKAAAARSSRVQPTPKVEEDSSESTRNHSTLSSPHRPILPSHVQPQASFRLMQTFHHSAPRAAPATAPTVDRLVLPISFASEEGLYDPYANIRVPLLPDTSFPSASVLQPESTDAPLLKPEILVVATNPELVLPAALTEVEGMGVDGVELKFAHEQEQSQDSWEVSGGMIRDLWKGLVDDVMGPAAGTKKPAF